MAKTLDVVTLLNDSLARGGGPSPALFLANAVKTGIICEGRDCGVGDAPL
jgi:hypothetical protein